MADKAILYDATKCTACRGCQAACKQWNENDEKMVPAATAWTRTKYEGSYENPPDLSPSTWLKMEFRESNANGQPRWLFARRACMHCTDAGCVKVCPNGTLYHHPLGFVSYNKDTCTGCGYCVEACPFKVPRYTRNLLTGFALADKCTFCTTKALDRIAAGQAPACVKTCPPKALMYDDRDKLVALGKSRVQALQAKGANNAYLYGEKEMGGLHVMYVLEDKPEVYGLPAAPRIPEVSVAWKGLIQPLGWVVGGLTIVGLALNFIVAKANVRKEEEDAAKRS